MIQQKPNIEVPPQGTIPEMSEPQGMRMRMQMAAARRKEFAMPQWIIGRSVAFFFIAMFACWIAFEHVPNLELIAAASVSIVLFFYGGYAMSRSWATIGEKHFLKNIYVAGFVVRLIWVLYMFFIFNPNFYGTTYGDGADVEWYMPFAQDIAEWIWGRSEMTFSEIVKYNGSAIDDIGYPLWLGVGYAIWGKWSDVFMPMLIKCVVGAYCAICIYHIAQRHFGEGTARMAAIFVCLNPNMIYWCATMMKEAEMVFFVCLAADNFDRVLSSGQRYTFKELLPGILAGLALMFFRTALGLVFFLAVFAHIVMASNRVMSTGKRIVAGVLVGLVLAVSMGDRILNQSKELMEMAQSKEKYEQNLNFRANRQGGNSFAKYATTAVFAPLIFTIPFPTFNTALETQIVQVQLAGGSYVKNVFSVFVIYVMFIMLISGEWRRHVFILAYTLGYLIVLVMSSFAQSGRFHMPIWPMLLLFAAYGIQVAKKNKKIRKWFPLVLVVEVLVCLAWNWFKLKGRGMI